MCNDPAPQNNGRQCAGGNKNTPEIQTKDFGCNFNPCPSKCTTNTEVNDKYAAGNVLSDGGSGAGNLMETPGGFHFRYQRFAGNDKYKNNTKFPV